MTGGHILAGLVGGVVALGAVAVARPAPAPVTCTVAAAPAPAKSFEQEGRDLDAHLALVDRAEAGNW